jgi:hypothetical protein
MVRSTCVKCSSSSFELVEAKIDNAQFKHCFVQCRSCGGVVGVLPICDIESLIRELAGKLNVHLG